MKLGLWGNLAFAVVAVALWGGTFGYYFRVELRRAWQAIRARLL